MADLELTSNVLVNNFIASDLSITYLVELSSISETNNTIFDTLLQLGTDHEMSSTIQIISNIEIHLSTIHDEILSSNILFNSFINCKLEIQIKCFNCQFNSTKSFVKNGPKCFRLARSKNENNLIDCIMYKKIKDN